jgi:hypothetical protein
MPPLELELIVGPEARAGQSNQAIAAPIKPEILSPPARHRMSDYQPAPSTHCVSAGFSDVSPTDPLTFLCVSLVRFFRFRHNKQQPCIAQPSDQRRAHCAPSAQQQHISALPRAGTSPQPRPTRSRHGGALPRAGLSPSAPYTGTTPAPSLPMSHFVSPFRNPATASASR